MPACGASGQGDDTPAQYPYFLNPGLTISSAAATASVLEATLISMAVGALILVPSLLWLYILFQRIVQWRRLRPVDAIGKFVE